MKMNKTLLSAAVAVGLLSTSSVTHAAGFQLAEYSATGLGRAYAGEAAMTDNAGAQWRNLAMLTYLEGTQVSVQVRVPRWKGQRLQRIVYGSSLCLLRSGLHAYRIGMS